MNLKQELKIQRGVTALIGGGGKTTCMYALARELSENAKVIICTSTHIYPPTHLPCLVSPDAEQIRKALQQENVVCVGTNSGEGKLSAPPLSFPELESLADYVIVEADGSRAKPLKAHAAHEPVIPEGANQTVLLLGITGIGQTILQAAHRPELYSERLGVELDTVVTPELAAAYVRLENLHTRVLVNQVESEKQAADAKRLAQRLFCPVCMGALKKGWLECLY